MKNLIKIYIIFLIILSVQFACRKDEEQKISEPEKPRIVSLAPSLTEIVFALGMGEHLVGVTDHCNYPKEALTKPRLGGLKTINLEAVLSKEPDIVLATRDGNDIAFLDQLKSLGLNVKAYQPKNTDQVLETILEIGKELGKEEQAEQLIKNLKGIEEDVASRLKDVEQVPVFLFFSHEPLIAAGPTTFADDLIRKAGGLNMAQDAKLPYPHYSMEMVIEKSPAVIFDVSMAYSEKAQEQAEIYWSKWKDLSAVRNKNIYALNSDLITRPGPRIFQGLLQMAKIIHPEKFKEDN